MTTPHGYQFDNDIPPPVKTARSGIGRTHPFWFMEKGQSVFFAGANGGKVSAYGRVVAKRRIAEGESACAFTVESRTESGVEGVRAWRVE